MPRKRYERHALEDWIEFANLLGADVQSPELLRARPREEQEAFLHELVEAFGKRFGPRSGTLFDEVFGAAKQTGLELGPAMRDRWREHDRWFLYYLYVAVRGTLEELLAIAEQLREIEPDIDREVVEPILVSIGSFGRALAIGPDRRIQRYRDVFYDVFLEALVGQEIERLKRCPISTCGNLFWAVPKNKGACSERCLVRHRVQKFRAKQKEYESKRQHNKRRNFKAKERIRLAAALRRIKVEVESK